ncbi:MAG: 23S rRNA (adenine(2503)-C(2))-methyltransferase RlmN [Legionellales bacterium]|nr:23S rRNA (adenine(2503)-C(2))-methyltransferase RlmN [Legionellales bacterium]|tara:strand:- start:1039 stop:2163 length:1125 start_codon:yes stop_codon:yes gene_type:complete
MQATVNIPVVQVDQSRVNILNLDSAQLAEQLKEMQEPRFRADQILSWIHQKQCLDFNLMTNLSLALREKLSLRYHITLPKIVKEFQSVDGTIKWLIQPQPGSANVIETVYIPERQRATLCISSQVGCILDCKFCHTGRQGFNRNLNVAEIVGQVLLAKQRIHSLDPNLNAITNIVYMGMGEPLLNEKNVTTSLGILLSDHAHGFSKYRVTVSTVGIVPAMKRLKAISSASLALSLHAPNDQLREQIIPINSKYPVSDIIAVCREYFNNSKRKVTIEYIMLDQINDSNEQAKELTRLLHDIPCKINLIPFNPFPGSAYRASPKSTIERFQKQLMKSGFITTVRKERGSDILGACGQLAGTVLNKRTTYARPSTSN